MTVFICKRPPNGRRSGTLSRRAAREEVRLAAVSSVQTREEVGRSEFCESGGIREEVNAATLLMIRTLGRR